MTVYVDELVILNLYISFFLLLATEKLIKRQVTFWRRLSASSVSALFSLYIFLPEIHFMLSFAVRLVMSMIIVLKCFGIKNKILYLKTVAVFLSANFIFAGIMYGVWQIFVPTNLVINNSFVYLSVSPLMLIVTTAVCYCLIWLYRKIIDRNAPKEFFYDVVVIYKDKSILLKALLDTGNSLYYLFSDKPVIVVPISLISPLFDEKELSALKSLSVDSNNIQGYRLIPFNAVGINGVLPAFSAQCRLKNFDKTAKIIVAVNRNALSSDYDAIISCDLIHILEV